MLQNEKDNISKTTINFLNLNRSNLKDARKFFYNFWFGKKERPKSFRFIDL